MHWRSMRFRLTVTGFLAIYLPVVVLAAVAVVTTDSTSLVDTGTEVDLIVDRQRERPWWVIATAVLFAPVAAAIAWWWAGRAVRPIERIRDVAEEIEAGHLEDRIGLRHGPTELVALAGSFDSMLDRLADAATTQSELIDEAGHELRTPLTILRTNADVTLADPDPTPERYRDALVLNRVTAERMGELLDTLMLEARSRTRSIDRAPTDVIEVIGSVVATARPLAAEREVQITVEGPDSLPARVDRLALGRALTNLLDNAIRHARRAGAVAIDVRDEGDRVVVGVTDDGPGIEPADLPHVLDRNWTRRTDAASGSGRGLGLAIARQIAEAHGGHLSATSPVTADGGSCFELVVRL